MIHSFGAGFAGCIGVLVALWCWNSISERQANRRIERHTQREWDVSPEQQAAHQREWEAYARRR